MAVQITLGTIAGLGLATVALWSVQRAIRRRSDRITGPEIHSWFRRRR
ncbi:MAG TPA: hypothetical protein VMU51_15750 [Mycobacteriales bacterium]|nr:hypothetical protein [Mycobacteriales bacterium]